MAKKTALCGVLIALALVLAYLESLVPIPIGVPGVKPGLANLVVLAALYLLSPWQALLIAVARIALSGLLFGSMSSMLYALCGGLLSFAVMALLRRSDRFSPLGVSVAGGVSHNIGQMAVALWVTHTPGLLVYLPVLLVSGTLAGALVGLLGGWTIGRLSAASGSVAEKSVDESDKT